MLSTKARLSEGRDLGGAAGSCVEIVLMRVISAMECDAVAANDPLLQSLSFFHSKVVLVLRHVSNALSPILFHRNCLLIASELGVSVDTFLLIR
jgi:hypothetical protein